MAGAGEQGGSGPASTRHRRGRLRLQSLPVQPAPPSPVGSAVPARCPSSAVGPASSHLRRADLSPIASTVPAGCPVAQARSAHLPLPPPRRPPVATSTRSVRPRPPPVDHGLPPAGHHTPRSELFSLSSFISL
ncbi:hypothetical protein VPH35_021178 [Triticum aestivum]